MGRLGLKRLKLSLLRVGFNFCYQCFYQLNGPHRKRVTFATMRSATLTDNLAALHTAFVNDNQTDLRVFCYHYDRSLKSKFGFLWASIRALHALATSELFIIDDYFFPLYAIHKRPKNQVIQLWHAVGSLKKFGLSLPNAERSVLKPHTNYDWVFINAAIDKPAYVEAFDVDPNHVLALGEPMMDQLMRQVPEPHAGAKRLLYSPTYRGGLHGEAQVISYVQKFIEAAKRLSTSWDIYISLHPYIKVPRMT